MSLSLFFGVLTLTPAVMALAILGLGFSQRARAPLALGLVALGALVPAISLLLLAPDLSSGVALHVALWPGQGVLQSWFAPLLRMDHFGLFMAFGLAFLVTPLLLWIGWHSTQPSAETAEDTEELEEVEAPEALVDSTEDSTEDAGESTDEADDEGALSATPARPGILSREQWASLALVLGIESAGLMLCFAENILWLGAMWLIVVALIWVLGELGSDSSMLDRRGLGVMLAGPILWIAAMLLAAVPLAAPRLYDLMGRGSVPALKILLLGLTLALAGGAYPFLVWVRRRAAFTTPAGFGAVLLVALPVAAVVGARTYSAMQDTASLWPQLGSVTPPITIGIFISLLGALTIGISGLLALGRADGRSLLALLGSAQAGWVLFALGTGQPATMVGVVVLLTTMVLGLGAMLASLVAGGMVTTDLEPAGAGPRPFGVSLRGIQLFAWCVGAVALVGAPLFAGFISRQMITASALSATKLAVPLVGLAWAGDALLALALLRATAPAFLASPASEALDADESDDVEEADATDATLAQLEATGADDSEDAEEEVVPTPLARKAGPFSNVTFGEALGAIFAALALLIGFAPQWLLAGGGLAAAGDLVQPGAVAKDVALRRFGYQIGASQWDPTIAWIILAILVVIFGLMRFGMARVSQPAQTAGYVPALALAEPAEPEAVETAEAELGEAPLTEPTEIWKDLTPAFRSSWALPASDWLLSGVEDDSDTAQPAEALDEEELEDELEDEPMSEEEAGTEGATISHGKRASARTPSDEDAGGQA